MKIILDLGNSRLKIGLLPNTDPTAPLQLSHPLALPYDRLELLSNWLTTHIGTSNRTAPAPATPAHAPHQLITRSSTTTTYQAVGISVVGPERMSPIERIFATHHCAINWLNARTQSPQVHNAYRQQKRLGADRWFGALGALQLHSPRAEQALIYCSFGTATTIDLILPAARAPAAQQATNTAQKDWLYLGGLILPGPYLMYQSLDEHTAGLYFEQGQLQDIPDNTRSAISSGITAAQIGALRQQIHHALRFCPEQPVLTVCAGGGWPLVQAAVKKLPQQWAQWQQGPAPQIHYAEHPVLHGLGSLMTRPSDPS